MSTETKAQYLIDLVDYQEGSVVSRTLMQKDAGTVTLFAFDKGESLSEHTTTFDAMVYVFDGKAEVTISGHPTILEKGETIIMPADKPHALEALEKFKMMLIMIKS